MEKKELSHSFIQYWLKAKKDKGEFNQVIINAIEKCLGGSLNEELDEANLLKQLKEIKYEENND